MGLGSIEIVMEVESTFGVQIDDHEASGIERVGQLVDCVLAKTQLAAPDGVCPSARVFHQVRRTLVDHGRVERRAVRPATVLSTLLPRPRRRDVWAALHRAGADPPALGRPDWLSVGMALAVMLLTAEVCALLTWRISPMAGGLAFLPAMVIFGLVAYAGTWPAAQCVPATCRTVRDLVVWCAPGRTARPELARSHVFEKIRLIIADVEGLPPERVTEDAHFYDDLNL